MPKSNSESSVPSLSNEPHTLRILGGLYGSTVEIYLDEKKLNGVLGLRLDLEPGTINRATLVLQVTSDVNLDASVKSINPDTHD